MSLAPQSLYQPLSLPSSYWMMLNRAANTMATHNRGSARQIMAPTPPIVSAGIGASNRSTERLWQSQSLGAAADCSPGSNCRLNDSVTASNLQTLGTIRANSQQRQAAINTLQSQTQSADPAQHTELATLQRINQALILQLQLQQEANQICQASALQQIVAQKQQQDALKDHLSTSQPISPRIHHTAPSFTGASTAMRY